MRSTADKLYYTTPAVARVMRKRAKPKLADMSIHQINPFLSDYPFVVKTRIWTYA